MSLTEIAVAHRGGAGLGPENTLRTFAMSRALGVRLLETDVRITKDGVALAFHDSELRRTTGLRGHVRDYPWEDLRFARVGGEPLLRLDALLDAFPDCGFLIDVKDASAVPAMIDVIGRTRSAERVCVAGGWDHWLGAVTEATGAARALGWKALTSLMWSAKIGVRPPSSLLGGSIGAHVPTRLAGLGWMADERAARRFVEMAHDVRLRLLTWTVNDPAQMRRYLDAGVDAVITDRPDLLREILVSRHQWNATPALGSTDTPTISPTFGA